LCTPYKPRKRPIGAVLVLAFFILAEKNF
jgi:hypothetical protein